MKLKLKGILWITEAFSLILRLAQSCQGSERENKDREMHETKRHALITHIGTQKNKGHTHQRYRHYSNTHTQN